MSSRVYPGCKPGRWLLLALFLAAGWFPLEAQVARSGRFSRGTGTDPSQHSFVIPLESQKGVALDLIDGNVTNLFPANPFTQDLYHLNATNGWATQTNSVTNRIRFRNPIVAFGRRVGGSPLYLGQPYSFGVYAGERGTEALVPNYTNIYIHVFNRSNMVKLDTIRFAIPVHDQGNPWTTYLMNSYEVSCSGYGLSSYLTRAHTGDWGVAVAADQLDGNYVLTHVASAAATNYVFQVQTVGWMKGVAMVSGTDLLPNGNLGAIDSRLYTLEFEERAPLRPRFVDQPQFDGEPLPPGYQGKALSELLTNSTAVNVTVASAATNWLSLDDSPELRQHPILDRIVTAMASNAIALSSFVHNEIRLTDAVSYNDSGSLSEASVNLGGVSRSALATLQERQGSPMEQCALLVYLLRRAGVPSAYMFAGDNQVKLLDARLSRLLRLQVVGAVNDKGQRFTTNSLISVNYPWVAARIGTNWMHLFPWLKDTEVIEGLDLYDYMPTDYNNGMKWLLRYATGNSAILSLSPDTDAPSVLFPLYIQQQLLQSAPGVSVDDIGLRAVDRKRNYSRWTDFPKPTWLATNATASTVKNLTEVTNVFTSWTNIFDTLDVEVFSQANPNTKLTVSGLRLVDLHNRRFLLRHEVTNSTVKMVLSLAPLRPGTTGTNQFSNDAALLTQQDLRTNLAGTDDVLTLRLKLNRLRTLPANTTTNSAWASFLGFQARDRLTNEFVLRKGDLAAICLSYGRVTEEMVRTQIQEFNQTQQQVLSGALATNAVHPDIYVGGLPQIMGMSYLERLGRFVETNERLHKVHVETWFTAGLAKLTAKHNAQGALLTNPLELFHPAVDFQQNIVAVVGAGAKRLDQGHNIHPALDDFKALNLAELSAQEHLTLEHFFGRHGAVSTVRLLRMSAAAFGFTVILTPDNYTAADAAYSLNSADPVLWNKVTNCFRGSLSGDEKYTQVFITRAPVTDTVAAYTGMAAMVFGIWDQAAWISSNGMVQNGGVAPPRDGNENLGNTDVLTNEEGGAVNDDATIRGADSNGTLSAQQNTTTLGSAASGLGSGAIGLNPNQALANQTQPGTDPDEWFLNNANLGGGNLTGVGLSYDQPGASVADPVNLVTGAFQVDATDLVLAGPMPISLRRSYDSRSMDQGEIRFGYGWRINFQPYLRLTDTNLIYAAEMDGTVVAYRQTGAGTNCWKVLMADNPGLTEINTMGAGSTVNLFNNWITNRVESGLTNYYLYGSDGSTRKYTLQSFPIPGYSLLPRTRPYLMVWTDARGNSWTFGFGTDSSQTDYGQVNIVQSSNGNRLGFVYDEVGHIVEAFSLDGRRVSYDYDASGDLVGVTLPDDSETRYEYQHGLYQSRIETRNVFKTPPDDGQPCNLVLSRDTNVVYLASGYPSSVSIISSNKVVEINYCDDNPVSTNVLSLTYTTNSAYSEHLLTKEIKPDGRVLQNVYDSLRRVTQQAATAGGDLQLVTNAVFYYVNNVTSLTNQQVTGTNYVLDVLGRTNRYEIATNLVTRMVDGSGGAVIQDWFEGGETNKTGYYPRAIEFRIDKRGLKTSFEYDSRGNVVKTIQTGDLTGSGLTNETAVWSYTYTTNNLVSNATDPMLNRTEHLYDANLLLTNRLFYARSNGVDVVVRTDLVVYTNVAETVNLGGGLQTNRAFGLPWRVVQAGATNETSFDGRGWVTGITRYPKTPDLAGTTDPAVTAAFYYNDRGEQIETTDALSRKQAFAYDGLGRPIQREVYEAAATTPLSWEYSYYNPNGELTWSDGPRYNPEDYVWRDYDGGGRQTVEIRWRSQAKADGSGVEAVPDDTVFATGYRFYDAFGNETNRIDALGNYVRMAYDAVGQLTNQVFYSATGTTLTTNRLVYGPGGLVSKSINPAGAETRFFYTHRGKLYRQENPDGSVLRWTYHADGRPKREYLVNGSYWETTYQDWLRQTTRTLYDSGGAQLAYTTTTTDARGNPTSVRDLDGKVFTKTFDGLDRVKTATGPSEVAGSLTAQQTTTYLYDNAGAVVKTVNGLGETNVVVSDALGRTVGNAVFASGSSTPVRTNSMAYSVDHHSVTTTAGSGAGAISSTVFTDTYGKTVLTKSGIAGQYELNTFDVLGNLMTHRDEMGRITSARYDGLNRQTQSILPDGATNLFVFDGAGNVLTNVLPGDLRRINSYDSANRLTATRLQQGGDTNKITLSTGLSYYTNGAVGLLWKVTDGRGITRTASYDSRLRLQSEGWSPTGESRTFSYDNSGRMTALEQVASGLTTRVDRQFNAYGQITRELVSSNGAAHSDFTQTWNAAGRRSYLTQADSRLVDGLGYGDQVQFGWLADGSLGSVTQGGLSFSYGYGNNGLLNTRTSPWRTWTATQRDARGRLQTGTTTVGGSTVLTEALTWRADSKLDLYGMTRGAGGSNESRDYDYNTRGQLTTESFLAGVNGTATATFGYDANKLGVRTSSVLSGGLANKWEVNAGQPGDYGRITSEKLTLSKWHTQARGNAVGAQSVSVALDGVAQTVRYQMDNTKGEWEADLAFTTGSHTTIATATHPLNFGTQTTSSATNTFTPESPRTVGVGHDGTGNVTTRTLGSDRVQVLTWDGLGRLTKVTEVAGTNPAGTNLLAEWTAAYDGLNRRLWTVTTPGVGGVLQGALADVEASWFDPQVEFLEVAITENGRRTWLLHGPDGNGLYGGLQGVGGLEGTVRERDAQALGVLSDYFGNGAALVNGGTVTWAKVPVTSSGAVLGYELPRLSPNLPLAERLVWRGKRIEPTGLYWIGMRYYDPAAMKFLAPDPLGHAASWGLYDWAGNDPVNGFDPDGRDALFEAMTAYHPNTLTPDQLDRYLSGDFSQFDAGEYQLQQAWNNYLWGTVTMYASFGLGGVASLAAAPAVGSVLGYYGITSPTIVSLTTGAVGGFAADATSQAVQMAGGFRSEFDLTELALSTAVGAAADYAANWLLAPNLMQRVGAGKLAEVRYAQQFDDTLLAQQLKMHSPTANRDFIIDSWMLDDASPSGFFAAEVKTEAATLRYNQEFGYADLAAGRAIPRGSVARALGLDTGEPFPPTPWGIYRYFASELLPSQGSGSAFASQAFSVILSKH